MLFTDPLFLFYFLPFALAAHAAAARGARGKAYPAVAKACIFGLTLIFYGARETWWLIPLFICMGGDFLWAKLIHRTERRGTRRLLLWLSILQNVGLLALFKYGEHAHSLLPWLPRVVENGVAAKFPAGISFYTFESLSFVIDVYRREIVPPKRLLDYAAFLAMFPRFIAGPIARYKSVATQLAVYPGADYEGGLRLFVGGLFLKIVFADHFSIFAGYAFDHVTSVTMAAAWAGVFAYAMQLYFDFSGYSLMAIGLGRCLGFEFPKNFDRPYLSRSLGEFWNRWHMTLGQWVRLYVYFPLAVRARRPRYLVYPVILLTFVIIGLWHGLSMNYLLMGVWFGAFICVEAALGLPARLPALAGQALTFTAVLVGWTFGRSFDVNEAFRILGAMFVPARGGLSHNWALNLEGVRANPLPAFLCLLGIVYCFGVEGRKWPSRDSLSLRWAEGMALTALFVCTLALAYSARRIPFLYFQF